MSIDFKNIEYNSFEVKISLLLLLNFIKSNATLFSLVKKGRESSMKILVHLNHNQDKSYLLYFGKNLGAKQVQRLLKDQGHRNTIRELMARSTDRLKVLPQEKKIAQALADFTISQRGYTAQRLA